MDWNMFNNKNLKSKIEKELKKLPWEINFDKISELLKPAIGIKTIKSKNKIEIGKSKFGGLPDLPKGTEWPNLNGFPFAFVAQLNLAEIKFDNQNQLPKKGILYFFFTTNQTDYQFESFDRIHKVIYHSGNTNELENRNYPEKYDEIAKFSECSLSFFEYYSLPSYQNYQIIEENLSDDDENLLWEASELIDEVLRKEQDLFHQILGNPNAIQGDVSYWWAFQNFNILKRELEENEMKIIREKEKEIILLLQIDMMDEISEFSKFGGSGGLYFGINKNDLNNLNFENTKFVLQNS